MIGCQILKHIKVVPEARIGPHHPLLLPQNGFLAHTLRHLANLSSDFGCTGTFVALFKQSQIDEVLTVRTAAIFIRQHRVDRIVIIVCLFVPGGVPLGCSL